MLETSPSATGSVASAKTMGMVVVAALAAFAVADPSTTMTSMFERTRSAASSPTRFNTPPAYRSSIVMFLPST